MATYYLLTTYSLLTNYTGGASLGTHDTPSDTPNDTPSDTLATPTLTGTLHSPYYIHEHEHNECRRRSRDAQLDLVQYGAQYLGALS